MISVFLSGTTMASYSTNEFRGGLKIMLDGDPCSIIENEFVKPGKGQAFNRVKIRNFQKTQMLQTAYTLENQTDNQLELMKRRRKKALSRTISQWAAKLKYKI